MSELEIALEKSAWDIGIHLPIYWDYQKCPQMAVFGGTGSGKTYFSTLVLARIGLHIKDSEIILCDFKADTDFSFAVSSTHFYRFGDCSTGLSRAVEILRQRQQATIKDKHPVFFFFDEWASFLNAMEKKEAESAKQNLSMLLMLGRSFSIHCILSQQRLDASNFNSARDNFSTVIGLGRMSKEMVDMMFSEYKEVVQRNKPQGQGSAIVGSDFYNILVPAVRSREKLESAILLGMNRYP